MPSLFLDAPNLGEPEKAKLLECIDSTYVSTIGPFVREFESRFAGYVRAANAVSLQSGTAALHIALVECGIGPGDEVIVPALTFAATVNPILYTGATPVFADVDPFSWTLDPEKAEASITGRTRAIIPVHLYGNPCDMDSLANMAEKHHLSLIEDATESLGATWDGHATGTIGEFGCYSFNGNKLVTTGGGGMIVTRDPERGRHIRFLANQARDPSKGFFHEELGYNYRMTNLEAAMGLAQMGRVDDFLARKRRIAGIYREKLENLPGVRFQEVFPLAESSWWLPSFMLEEGATPVEQMQHRLKAAGVPTRRVFAPVVDYPYLRRFLRHDDFPVARKLFQKGLSLPASTLNSEEDTAWAAARIAEALS